MNIPVHPGLATWNRTEYADVLRARFAAIGLPENASHSYQCGWEDADTEMLETERHRQALADGKEDDFETTWGLLFDAGGDARVYGIAFDESRTAPWKEGWIDADINRGDGDCEEIRAARSQIISHTATLQIQPYSSLKSFYSADALRWSSTRDTLSSTHWVSA